MSVESRRTNLLAIRFLGALVLIPGLLRLPLPQADYHNIRHHDAAGEICPLHDHLLRWHPTASQADDIATVHWHWFLPMSAGEGDILGLDDHGSPARPVVHADQLDGITSPWSGMPAVGVDPIGGPIPPAKSVLPGPPGFALASLAEDCWPPGCALDESRTRRSPDLRTAVLDRLSRRNC